MAHEEGAYLGGVRDLPSLMDRCYVDPVTGCWHWRLCVNQRAARVSMLCPVLGKHTHRRGPQAAWILKHGRLPGQGQIVWSKCGHEDCVNPEHARAGTREQWGAHIARMGTQRGNEKRVAASRATARAKLARITLETAREIYAAEGTLAAIGARYGIPVSQVWSIKAGRTWKDAAPQVASVFAWRGPA